MAATHYGLVGNRSLSTFLSLLSPESRREGYLSASSVGLIRTEAKWQWRTERADGSFVAAVAVFSDGHRRGWVAGFPGEGMKAHELRGLMRLLHELKASGIYDELRAWIAADDQKSKVFAERMGFAYDCGPATALSPTGRDMSLYLWRAP